MRWSAALAVISVSAVLAPAAGGYDGPDVRVSPHRGGPQAAFAVGFDAPKASGRGVDYNVSVVRRAPREGCVDERVVPATAEVAGERVRVRLKPGAGERWCRGRYRGTVTMVDGPYCPTGYHCQLRPVPVECDPCAGAQLDCGMPPPEDYCCPPPPGPEIARAATSCSPPPSYPSTVTTLGRFRLRVR
jgi:hypothetical protein